MIIANIWKKTCSKPPTSEYIHPMISRWSAPRCLEVQRSPQPRRSPISGTIGSVPPNAWRKCRGETMYAYITLPVGGAITILKNMKVNGKDYPIYYGKKCSKPPTRLYKWLVTSYVSLNVYHLESIKASHELDVLGKELTTLYRIILHFWGVQPFKCLKLGATTVCFSIQLKFLYSVCSPYKQIVVLHDIVLYIKTSLICVCVSFLNPQKFSFLVLIFDTSQIWHKYLQLYLNNLGPPKINQITSNNQELTDAGWEAGLNSGDVSLWFHCKGTMPPNSQPFNHGSNLDPPADDDGWFPNSSRQCFP